MTWSQSKAFCLHKSQDQGQALTSISLYFNPDPGQPEFATYSRQQSPCLPGHWVYTGSVSPCPVQHLFCFCSLGDCDTDLRSRTHSCIQPRTEQQHPFLQPLLHLAVGSHTREQGLLGKDFHPDVIALACSG